MRKQYRSFNEARKFARSLGLKSQTEWFEYVKLGKLPKDIPRYPNEAYLNKGWNGWGDFLGTGNIKSGDIEYRSFEEAREFARSLGLKNRDEWRDYCKLGKLPKDVPHSPRYIYKDKGWKGIGDWLGTGNIASKDRKYRSFDEAREYAKSLGLKNLDEWRDYCKLGKLPKDVPHSPRYIYKDKGWKGWGDFLGTGNIATFNRKYRSFEEAREFARSLVLKSGREWNEYCKSGKKPNDIPLAPEHTYKDKGWKGWGDFLGTGTLAPKDRKYRSFEEAREFARSLVLKSGREWNEYCKSGKKPNDIPTTPNVTYKGKGWKGIGDWLGTGNQKPGTIQYRPLKEAREFVRILKINNREEWNQYCKSKEKPKDIPAAPWRTYSKSGRRRKK